MKFRISDRLKNISGNAIREIFDLLKQDDIISFAGGMPTTSTLPAEQVDKILGGLISKYGVTGCLQYESTRGKEVLLEQLEKYLRVRKNIIAGTKNLIVLAGGQQGIEYMCKTFLNKGDVVLVESPTYLAALQIIATYEGKAVGVDSHSDGLDLKDLEEKIKKHKPKFLYVVPTFSNPTGWAYSLENRKRIAEITAQYDVMVLEDDPYAEIRFEGEYKPCIKTFDKCGNVVYLASFSKIIAPSLRIAVAAGHPQVIDKFVICKQATDVCAPSINQLIVAEFLREDMLERHLKEIIPVYKQKRDKMVQCIERHMPKTFEYSVPDGGLFIWGSFKDGRDLLADFGKVIKRKVAFLPGTHFYADGTGRNTMRLNFSNASLEQIEDGIKVLGEYFSSSHIMN